MTMKIAISAITISLLVSTAAFSVPASAQAAHPTITTNQIKKMIQHAFNAGYKAGLRRNGSAASSRNAYNRGYNDAMNRLASNSRGAVTNWHARNPSNVSSNEYTYARYAGKGSDSYARYNGGGYDTYARYDNGSDAYARYNGDAYDTYARYNGDGYSDRRDYNINPIGGLLNLIFAPLSAGSNLAMPNDRLAYCSARYRSFDPGSGTFLAYDGNRYSC